MTMSINATVVEATDTLLVLEARDEPIVVQFPGKEAPEPERPAIFSNTEGHVTRVRVEIERDAGGPQLELGDVLYFGIHFGPEPKARKVEPS